MLYIYIYVYIPKPQTLDPKAQALQPMGLIRPRRAPVVAPPASARVRGPNRYDMI